MACNQCGHANQYCKCNQTWESRDPLANAALNPVTCALCGEALELGPDSELTRTVAGMRFAGPIHESCAVTHAKQENQMLDRLEEYLDFQASQPPLPEAFPETQEV